MPRTLDDLEEHKRELVTTLDVLLAQGVSSTGLIRNLLAGLHYADLADVLDVLEPERAAAILGLLDPGTASDALAEMEEEPRGEIAEIVDPKTLATLVEEMDSDDAADVVGEMDAPLAAAVLEHVSAEERKDIRELLVHDEETAGGLMAAEFVVVDDVSTVDQAIEAVRYLAAEIEDIYYVYVVDDEEHLTGLVSLPDLLLNPGERRIRDIMDTDIVSAPVGMDQEEVARLVAQYDLAAIPVVDISGRLVGRITHDDIADVLEDEREEDIHRMAGVIGEEFHERSSLRVAARRLPWIVTSLVSALLASVIISLNHSLLESYIALAAFFPVITAIGGNIGLQSSTIVVRGLATGQMDLVHVGSRILKELRVGIAMGIACGLVVGLVSWLWMDEVALGLVVGLSMLTAITTAATMGALVPITFDRLKVDPALATGPFVTMSNDIIGLIIYFSLAGILLRAFGIVT
jgi:magnesium transporter